MTLGYFQARVSAKRSNLIIRSILVATGFFWLGHTAATASKTVPIVSFGAAWRSSDPTFAAAVSGETFMGGGGLAVPWQAGGTVPSTSPIVAIRSTTGGSVYKYVVTENGDVFKAALTATEWAHETNVFSSSGVPSSGSPVVDVSQGPFGIYAVTSAGDIFLGVNGVSGWRYIRNVYDGIVGVQSESWSRTKQRYFTK